VNGKKMVLLQLVGEEEPRVQGVKDVMTQGGEGLFS